MRKEQDSETHLSTLTNSSFLAVAMSSTLITMDQEDWMLFVKDMDLSTVKVSRRDAREIFLRSQLDCCFDDGAAESSEMIFPEFIEGCVALSMYLDPSPHVPLSIKVDKFFGAIVGDFHRNE